MASEPEAAAGAQTEIIVKPQLNGRDIAPKIVPLALLFLFLFAVVGIGDTLGLLAIVLACGSLCHLANRCYELARAVYDDEGMTLLSRGIGHLMARSLHFRWDEVFEVRRRKLFSNAPLILLLNRPRKSWMFRSQLISTVRIPNNMWKDPQFAQAIRAHVPAERVHTEESSERYWRIFVLVILACAVLAAACSLVVSRSVSYSWGIWSAFITLYIGSAAMSLCDQRAREGFRLIQMLLHTLFLLVLALLVLLFSFPASSMAIMAGYLGAAAGALMGSAAVIANGRRSHGWYYAGATCLLAAAGFAFGWSRSAQIREIRLGFGSLDFRSPWTPKGDAFLMIKEESEQTKTICWYSSSGKLERSAVLPATGPLRVIGQDAALFTVRAREESQLWLVPRRAEARVIDKAPGYSNCRISPDFRRALIAVTDAPGGNLSWRICDLETGKVAPVNFPVPLKDISVIAPRSDGTVVWLTGSRPLDKGKNLATRRTALPESGEFPYPGVLYRMWTWKINSAEPPAQIYSAKTQWLEWHVTLVPGQLYVWRVSEKPPAHVECVEIDLRQSRPTETVIPEEVTNVPLAQLSESYDGRFEPVASKAGVLYMEDTKTGKMLPLLATIRLFGPAFGWSPSANQFLVQLPELSLREGLWCWHRGFEKTFETSMAVYFVDMDRQ